MKEQEIARRYLQATQSLEEAYLKQLREAMKAAYKSQERQLMTLWQRLAESDSTAVQSQLARAKELNQLAQKLFPKNAAQLEARFAKMLAATNENGQRMADEFVRLNEPESTVARAFGTGNLEAAALQAQDGMKRLKNHSDYFASQASQLVQQTLLEGKSATWLRRSLREKFGHLTKARAENIARTETMSALNAAATQRYKEYGMEYVQLEALIDERTTPECRARHLKIIRLEASHPPYHFQCRTIARPIKPEWLNPDQLKWMESEINHAMQGLDPTVLNQATVFETLNNVSPPKLITPNAFQSYATPPAPPLKPKEARLPEGTTITTTDKHGGLGEELQTYTFKVGDNTIEQFYENMTSYAKSDYPSAPKIETVEFKVNGSYDFSENIPDKQRNRIAVGLARIMKHKTQNSPEGTLFVCSAWDEDGKFEHRVKAYKRFGFGEPEPSGFENSMFAVIKDGKLVPYNPNDSKGNNGP